MKAEIIKPVISVNLQLSGDEARLLKQILQNPIHDPEPQEEQNLRSQIWEALAEVDPFSPKELKLS